MKTKVQMSLGRRCLVALAGMSLGVAGALAAAAPASAATNLGGVDVLGYCKSQFNVTQLVGTTHDPNNAYSWKCTYAGIPLSYGVNMNAACNWKYKGGAWAWASNAGSAYSWRCYR